MHEKNYIVQFVRKDHQPDEEYIYNERHDAEHHLNLFRNDDSGIYKKVVLLAWFGNITSTLKEIKFA